MKRFWVSALMLGWIFCACALATNDIIELDSQNSQTLHRLHTIMPLSTIQDISHLEIDLEEQQVIVHKEGRIDETNSESESSPATLVPLIVPAYDVQNLPWHLTPDRLRTFLSQHTAWLTPLEEKAYKLEFRGVLLGGGDEDSTNNDGGGGNGWGGDYSSNYSCNSSGQCYASDDRSQSDGYYCDSNGRCYTQVTITGGNNVAYDSSNNDSGRSYGKCASNDSSSNYGSSSNSTVPVRVNNQPQRAVITPAKVNVKALAGLFSKVPAAKAVAPAKPADPQSLHALLAQKLQAKPVPAPKAVAPAKPVDPVSQSLQTLFAPKNPPKPAPAPAPKAVVPAKPVTSAKPAPASASKAVVPAKPATSAKPAPASAPKAVVPAKPVTSAKPAPASAPKAVVPAKPVTSAKPAPAPVPKPVVPAKPATPAKPTPAPAPSLSKPLSPSLQTFKIPGRVQTRINIVAGKGKVDVRSADNKLKPGIENILEKHMNPEKINKSQFTISKEEVVSILQDKKTVETPISRTVPSGNYVREVNVGKNIGKLPADKGNQSTSIVTILTDQEGNLVTFYPGPFNY